MPRYSTPPTAGPGTPDDRDFVWPDQRSDEADSRAAESGHDPVGIRYITNVCAVCSTIILNRDRLWRGGGKETKERKVYCPDHAPRDAVRDDGAGSSARYR